MFLLVVSCLDNFDPMSAWSSTSSKRFLANNWIKIWEWVWPWIEYGLAAFAFQSPHNLWLLNLWNYAAICGIQGFIQALLLILRFSWRINFMAVGHNPMCQHVGYKPPLWVLGAMLPDALAVSPIPGFQIVFPCIIRWPNLFHF